MGATEIRREIVLGGPLHVVPEGPFDRQAVFGRRAPLVVDIGAARARYFLNIAGAMPEVDFVGIEVRKKRVEAALHRLEKHELTNCRMIWGNALEITRDHLPEASVAAFTVLFPDPWPKKRHKKRRVFHHPETARLLASRLQPGGIILFKTDALPYLEPTREALQGEPLLEPAGDASVSALGEVPFSLDRPEETYYEEKWKLEGRSTYQLVFRRRAR